MSFEFATPEREADFILAIAREKLGRVALAAPAVALELRADTLLPYAPRAATGLPGAVEQAIGRERLLEDLAARLGRDRVFGIALGDDHRPERDSAAPSRGRATPFRRRGARTPRAANPAARPIWLLHRPQRLVAQAGQPALQGALEAVCGPRAHQSAGRTATKCIATTTWPPMGAERFWIYREHRDPLAWYLHGVFA